MKRKNNMVNAFIFDWGNTIMRDIDDYTGPMHSWPTLEVMPNAESMLAVLSAKAVCCLATNAADSSREDVVKALQRVNLEGYFKEIFCFRELGVKKPTSAFFETILKKLGMQEHEVVMVGDSLETDVAGALNYGLQAVLYDPKNLFPHYQGYRIRNLWELVEMF